MNDFGISNRVMIEASNILEMHWINFSHELSKSGISTSLQKTDVLKNSNFNFYQFASDNGFICAEQQERYSNTNTMLLFQYSQNVAIKIVTHTSHMSVIIFGEVEKVKHYQNVVAQNFQKSGPMITWVYSIQGDSTDIPLNSKGLVKSAYPFIEGDIESYIEEYINSDPSILILIGPPGTGKTSLIREIITRSKRGAHITYDPKIMDNDSMFIEFMVSSSMCLVLEDADAFLASRKDGNMMMHRFLNVGDGLLSTKGKKIIFSTNLENIGEIDTALMREGRCFDVVQTRNLTRNEAEKVREELDVKFELPDKKDFSFAEITNQIHAHKQKVRKVGFY